MSNILNALNALAKKVEQNLESAKVFASVSCSDYSDGLSSLDIDIEEKHIADWLSDDLRHWVNERPEIGLYTKFIVAAALEFFSEKTILSESLLYRVFKAMIYYGNYADVLKLAKSGDRVANDHYSMAKYIGKSYKSLGLYEKALNCYRKALLQAQNSNDELRTAFFLVLVGKICDDYHQKKGMRSFFYKSAYHRVQNLVASQNGKDLRHIELCTECYAKSIYQANINESNRIYDDILHSHIVRDELYIRIFLNRNILKIETKIHNFKHERYQEVVDAIGDVKTIIDQLNYEYYNERTYAVRSIQMVSLYRRLVEKLMANQEEDLFDEFFKDYSVESFGELLSECKNICEKYNEKKFLVFALLETVRWTRISYKLKGSQITQAAHNENIKRLRDAVAVLAIEGHDRLFLLSDSYIDVLLELTNIYVATRDFSNALSVYKKIYNHLEFILLDMNEYTHIIRKPDKDLTRSVFSELSILTKNEFQKLAEFVCMDYESLTSNLLSIGKIISSIQYNEALKFADETIKLSRRIDFHTLNRLINGTIDAMDEVMRFSSSNEGIGNPIEIDLSSNNYDLSHFNNESENLKDAISSISQATKNTGVALKEAVKLDAFREIASDLKKIRKIIASIHADQRELMKGETFSILIETQQFLSAYSNRRNCDIRISKEQKDIEICYSKKFFEFILNSLISNVEELATQDRKYSVEISYTREWSITYLHIKDDVGCEKELQDTVDLINKQEFNQIARGNRGTSLATIKRITNVEERWQVKLYDDSKELIIPIC